MIRWLLRPLKRRWHGRAETTKGYDGDDLFGGDRETLMIFGAFTMDEQLMETGMMTD
jgi:hypothetical protein